MGIKKFIESVKESLGIDELKKVSKRKSIKSLLKKLRGKKEKLSKSLDKKSEKKLDKKELQDKKEELKIILIQIKKGETILEELNSVKHKS